MLISTVNCRWGGFNPSPFSVKYFDATELAETLAGHGFRVEMRGGFPESSGGSALLLLSSVAALRLRADFEASVQDTWSATRRVWESLRPPVGLPSMEWVCRKLAVIDSAAKYFEQWMHGCGARMGITVSYYSLFGLSFNLACRRASIPSVDIQHGFQTGDHSGYADWQAIPPVGFELLPEIFWCWSELERKQIESWSAPAAGAHRAIVAGNIWHEFCSSSDITAASRATPARKTDNILVSLQPWPADISGRILQVMQRTPQNWVWWLRLHPSMRDTDDFAQLENMFHGLPNVFIREATETPLPVLLGRMDLHITAHSSTVIEACQFGVHSIIVDDSMRETFRAEIDCGMVHVASTPEQIAGTACALAGRLRTQPYVPQGSLFNAGLLALYAAAGLDCPTEGTNKRSKI